MLFTEALFFAFFAVVFTLYWALPRNRPRKILLLVASYFFYAAWDWRFCGLILLSTAIDYYVGRRLGGGEPDRKRHFWVSVSVVANLVILGFFKYFNFFVESANSVFGWFELGEVRTLYVILPVGISFYTFQTMSYTIDLYRRRMEPVESFVDFAVFVSFFPQLVMGPILRAAAFLPQLSEKKQFAEIPFKPLLTLFLIGFIKKACVSDNIAPLVDSLYADPDSFTTGSIWIVIFFYAVQLYCDFSGYTDMAIAVAGLLGYRVPRNFDFPFLARNVADFWRRWHISFSSWLRDYLYVPLGGSRGTEFRTLVNLMLTMLLSGLWHGAGWTFITWGALNGLSLCVERSYRKLNSVPAGIARVVGWVGWPLTFFWFAFTLIFFRAPSFSDAFTISRGLLLVGPSATEAVNPLYALWFLPLAVAHWLSWRFTPTELSERVPTPLYALLLGLLAVIAASFVRMEYRPFIYFQF